MQGRVSEWAASLARSPLPGDQPARSIVKGNVRNLLRSVYFICGRDEVLRRRIEESLAEVRFA